MEETAKGLAYRVNPFCPKCKEEHLYFTIYISEKEQEILDDYYEVNKDRPHWELLIAPAPLVIEREFECPLCGTKFKKCVGIMRENQVGYSAPDFIPMGVVPVFSE
ncbi:MAG: hypothetical protein IKM15_07750 [Peptococcaceae bacterium]|nr:hypothetical protein [Peptococcaceae bacterium]